MIDRQRALGAIARLLAYPDEHYLPLAELLYVAVQAELPEAAEAVSRFGRFVERRHPHELEEVYTRTFDVNPACALEVGWHLFGEDYVRGQFLVRMRGELAKYEIPESGELPDHLTHVLAVIAAMPREEAGRFVHACVFPALDKIQKTLDKAESPYRDLIRCLVLVLEEYLGPGKPWEEDAMASPRRDDALPGRNGRRPPGMGDPLRAYPMPAAPCGSAPEIVPLRMNFSMPGSAPAGAACQPVGKEK